MEATTPSDFVKKSVTWSIVLSAVMIVAGMVAIASPLAAGIAVNLFVGWLLIFSGCMHLAFAWYRRNAGGFIWELLVGILYIVIGAYLLRQPVVGLESLTIALAIYLFMESILEFALGLTLRARRGSGWLLFDGVVTLILAVMIWRTWPSSATWVIGTLIGISMLFSGASRLAISLGLRRVAGQTA
jgi:uncharacterized membrane protein HdeD (DUF308 family)